MPHKHPYYLAPGLAAPGPFLHPIATATCLTPIRVLCRMSSPSSSSSTLTTLKGRPASTAPSPVGVKSPAYAASPALDPKRSTPTLLTAVAILEAASSGISRAVPPELSDGRLEGNVPRRRTTALPGHPQRRSWMRLTSADLGRPRSLK